MPSEQYPMKCHISLGHKEALTDKFVKQGPSRNSRALQIDS